MVQRAGVGNCHRDGTGEIIRNYQRRALVGTARTATIAL
jgi:hypothetical protein